MADFVPLITAAALVLGTINLWKQAMSGEWPSVFVQVVSWAAGVAVAFLVRASDWAAGITIGSGDSAATLANLNPWSVILVGVALAATANVAYSAIPNSNTENPFD